MDSDDELALKRIKFMNPYVQLNKAFIIKATPSIVKQFNNEVTSDVKVILGDENSSEKNKEVLHLHKIVLSSASHMFSTWLSKYSDIGGETVLKIPENYPWMQDFFRFFYTGHIMMTSENLVDIYTVADKYLVESLKIQCEDYIKESLKIKIEKMTCPHVKSVLSKCTDQDSTSSNNGESLPFFDPYGSLLRTRSTFSNTSGPNIFSNFNQLSSKSMNSRLSSHGNPISIFNSNTINASNSKNIFNRSLYDVFEKKNSDFESLNSKGILFDRYEDVFELFHVFVSIFQVSRTPPTVKLSLTNFKCKHTFYRENKLMDLFCDKCNPGPVTVSRILAFSTVVHLSQMTCNLNLSKLAKYNLIIRLTEELRSEDYSQFIQLPFQLLHDLLEDDNFYCSEFHLFCGIQHWIQSNKVEISAKSCSNSDHSSNDNKNDQIISQADKLINLIRFPVMSAEELYDVESSAASSGHFSSNLLQKLLHHALRYMVYRNVQKAKIEESWIGIPYKPRVPVEIIKLGMQYLS